MSTKLTIEKLWELDGFKPTPNQKEAILHVDGPLFLTAGPGSGKTRVLLWRTLNLIVFEGVMPEEIFLSTFTEKAAFQLNQGLKSLLALASNETGEPYDISKMSIGTIHSICHRMLTDRRFYKEAHRGHPPMLMDELEQYFYISNNRYWEKMSEDSGMDTAVHAACRINKYYGVRGKGMPSKHRAALNAMSFFNRMSEECVKPKEIKSSEEAIVLLAKMYDHYLKSLKGSKRVDLSMLQQIAFNVLSDYDGSTKVFKHVIIDEYQDTNTIQEKIFFKLASGHKNICIVGDDDQALYRFRGATVENLVEFEQRCKENLGINPKVVNLNINFRSRKPIIDYFTDFIDRIDWSKEGKKEEYYRIVDKEIKPHNTDKNPAVFASNHDQPENVCKEIAKYVKKLKETDKVEDYKQVAFLFPAMKNNAKVRDFKVALEEEGISVYAPRSGRFLDVDEARAIFGLFTKILGMPSTSNGMAPDYMQWLKECGEYADDLCAKDAQLTEYIKDQKDEIKRIKSDYDILKEYLRRNKLDPDGEFKTEMARGLANAIGLSAQAKKSIANKRFMDYVDRRRRDGRPFKIKYIINRATALDWSVLDLFYRLNGFKHFRKMYDLAEKGTDEGPICNLGLITQYLSRFMELYSTIITASFLADNKFINAFFFRFCYSLYRLEESEYEDVDDPFPKGRVPFLTIHQAKGLEFPIVVIGSVYKRAWGASKIEEIARDITKKQGEPLEKISEFDNMRMFYVGLSRAKNMLILPHFKGHAAATEPFKTMLQEPVNRLKDLDIKTLPEAKLEENDLGDNYSYTGDYLMYQKCPRNYMIFRKYRFVPSRTQTMLFGSLVHQTIEDLHHYLIANREAAK